MAVLVGKPAPDFTAVAVLGNNEFNETFNLKKHLTKKYGRRPARRVYCEGFDLDGCAIGGWPAPRVVPRTIAGITGKNRRAFLDAKQHRVGGDETTNQWSCASRRAAGTLACSCVRRYTPGSLISMRTLGIS